MRVRKKLDITSIYSLREGKKISEKSKQTCDLRIAFTSLTNDFALWDLRSVSITRSKKIVKRKKMFRKDLVSCVVDPCIIWLDLTRNAKLHFLFLLRVTIHISRRFNDNND